MFVPKQGQHSIVMEHFQAFKIKQVAVKADGTQ